METCSENQKCQTLPEQRDTHPRAVCSVVCCCVSSPESRSISLCHGDVLSPGSPRCLQQEGAAGGQPATQHSPQLPQPTAPVPAAALRQASPTPLHALVVPPCSGSVTGKKTVHLGKTSRCSQAGASALGTREVREGHLQSFPYEPCRSLQTQGFNSSRTALGPLVLRGLTVTPGDTGWVSQCCC